MKNFLLIILNNLSNIYGLFLNKNFFIQFFLLDWKTVLPIHNSELSSIHDAQKMHF